jgi:hypothetical protein
MSEIYDTNERFDFNKLVLTKPTPVTGGNYFIKCLVNNGPLYIQPPKCKTRQGILKAGKRFYTDLIFTNEDENFIQWMENLENNCQQFIYNNREKWFDGDMELHDIENYFTSPIKIFKSGKFYIARTNISTVLGKIGLKIYDENENEVPMENINDKTNIMTILEVQGIKCSTRSFQIELEMKQMMVLKPQDLFEKCIIKTKSSNSKPSIDNIVSEPVISNNDIIVDTMVELPIETEYLENIENIEPCINDNEIKIDLDNSQQLDETIENQPNTIENDPIQDDLDKIPPIETDGIEEVEFNLEELEKADEIQIKKRNDIYYEMYREARQKAKVARDLALSSYLEVKRIKNTYMLDDIEDSDESDLELDEENDNE